MSPRATDPFTTGLPSASVPPVTKLTKQEHRVLLVFLVLVLAGLAGKAWLALRPPTSLPPLPGSASPEPAR